MVNWQERCTDRGGQAVDRFVPRGKHGDLDEDGGEVHVTKVLGAGLEGERETGKPEGGRGG